eukprot:scaffold10403_cov101-Isochrysis_galbana.AAC.6
MPVCSPVSCQSLYRSVRLPWPLPAHRPTPRRSMPPAVSALAVQLSDVSPDFAPAFARAKSR